MKINHRPGLRALLGIMLCGALGACTTVFSAMVCCAIFGGDLDFDQWQYRDTTPQAPTATLLGEASRPGFHGRSIVLYDAALTALYRIDSTAVAESDESPSARNHDDFQGNISIQGRESYRRIAIIRFGWPSPSLEIRARMVAYSGPAVDIQSAIDGGIELGNSWRGPAAIPLSLPLTPRVPGVLWSVSFWSAIWAVAYWFWQSRRCEGSSSDVTSS